MIDRNQLLDFLRGGADMAALPFASPDTPRVSGAIKTEPEDFMVDEIPAYPFSGEGDHLMLNVRKRDIAGGDMIRIIARAAGIREEEIGTAGTKDRRAVTTQWISLPARAVEERGLFRPDDPDWPGVPGISVIQQTRHTNKLKPGHLRGNRFRIAIRGADTSCIDELKSAAATVSASGFPNLFGSQRFGRNEESLVMGLGVLGIDPSAPGGRHGRRIGNFERRMSVSAVQSALFNLWVKARFADGLSRTVLAGDVLAKTVTGGMFTCEDPDTDQARLEAGEIQITGPMFGTKLMSAQGIAGTREKAIQDAAGLDARAWGAAGKLAEGTRREMVVVPEAMSVDVVDDRIVFDFALPKGSYASVLMREFVNDTRGI